MGDASFFDRVRLLGISAPMASAWLEAVPRAVFEMKMGNAQLCSRMGQRLGAELCEERLCPFCFQIVDRYGAHSEGCMRGGRSAET